MNSSLISLSFCVSRDYSSALHDGDDDDGEVEVAAGEQRVELFGGAPVVALEAVYVGQEAG
jgi:hypothetical protein